MIPFLHNENMQAVNECLLKFILDSLPGKPPSACVSFKVMMHGCLCVCECVYAYLSLITFTVSLGLTINPASFIVTTRPINQCDTRRGDRPPVSCTFYQKIYFWSSLNRECGQFCMQRNNCEFFIA